MKPQIAAGEPKLPTDVAGGHWRYLSMRRLNLFVNMVLSISVHCTIGGPEEAETRHLESLTARQIPQVYHTTGGSGDSLPWEAEGKSVLRMLRVNLTVGCPG